MPKLPGPESLGAPGSFASGRTIATIDPTPLGRAVRSVGKGLSDLGNAIYEQQEKKKAFEAETAFQEFQWNEEQALEEAVRNMQPGQADAFAENWQKGYYERAKEFKHNQVAPSLRPIYDQKLFQTQRRLHGAALTFERKEQFRFADQQIDHMSENVWRQKARGAPTAYPTTEEFIKSEESFRSTPYMDVKSSTGAPDKLRAGHGSDTVTLPDGTVKEVTDHTVVSTADADRDLARRKKEFQATIQRQIGTETWDQLPENAKTGLTSLAYNAGSLPSSVVRAVETGDIGQIADAVEAYPHNPKRRAREAALIRGGGTLDDITRDVLRTIRTNPHYTPIQADIKARTLLADLAESHLDPLPPDQVIDILSKPADEQPLAITMLTDEERQKIIKNAESEIGRNLKDFKKSINDYTELLRDGGEPDPRYAPEVITDIFGDEEGAQLNEEIEAARLQGEKMNLIATASPEEIADIVQESVAGLNDPENYRRNRADVSALTNAIKVRNKALAEDPAGYVAGRLPYVSEAYENLTNAMESGGDIAQAAQAYATASEGAQLQLGLRPDQIRLLPEGLANSIVNTFMQQQEGGQNAAQLIQGMAEQWGDYWPTVYAQLAADKLPGTAVVIGAMNAPDQRLAAEALAEASKIGVKTLGEGVSSEDKTALKDAVFDDWREFRETLINQPNGIELADTFHDSIYLLALYYANHGDSYSKAASKAYENIIEKRYQNEGTYRVPVEYPAAAVRQGANRIRTIIGEQDLDLPTSLAGLPDEDVKAAYADALSRNGMWVTSVDERGLTLYDSTTRSVVTVNGNPVTVPWDTLIKAATAPRDEVEENKRRLLGPSYEMRRGSSDILEDLRQ